MHAHTNAYCVEGSKAPSDSAARGVPASPVIRLVAAPTPSHSGVSALTARLSAATCDPIPPVDHPFALHLLRLFSALSASRSLGMRCPAPLRPPSANWSSSHAFRPSPPSPPAAHHTIRASVCLLSRSLRLDVNLHRRAFPPPPVSSYPPRGLRPVRSAASPPPLALRDALSPWPSSSAILAVQSPSRQRWSLGSSRLRLPAARPAAACALCSVPRLGRVACSATLSGRPVSPSSTSTRRLSRFSTQPASSV